MSRQMSCHDMCKIVAWSDYYFTCMCKTNLCKFWFMGSWTFGDTNLWINMAAWGRCHFPTHIHVRKQLYFDSNFHGVYYDKVSSQQWGICDIWCNIFDNTWLCQYNGVFIQYKIITMLDSTVYFCKAVHTSICIYVFRIQEAGVDSNINSLNPIDIFIV